MTSNIDATTSARAVRAYYASKTASILEKYGPGPIVHFHTGMVDCGDYSQLDVATLRQQMRAAQQRMLDDSIRSWQLGHGIRLLDVGCGLGGTTIHCATQLNCSVTAVTDVAEHATLVQRFANACGVQAQVRVVVSDSSQIETATPFDACVALESSCYFNRWEWFPTLQRVLVSGAVVGIVDTFAAHASACREFDSYWKTRLGTVTEYEEAAKAAGFGLVASENLAEPAAGFWDLSRAYIQRCMQAGRRTTALERSAEHHLWLKGRFLDSQIGYHRLLFRKL